MLKAPQPVPNGRWPSGEALSLQAAAERRRTVRGLQRGMQAAAMHLGGGAKLLWAVFSSAGMRRCATCGWPAEGSVAPPACPEDSSWHRGYPSQCAARASGSEELKANTIRAEGARSVLERADCPQKAQRGPRLA